jgi:hypothetical protein
MKSKGNEPLQAQTEEDITDIKWVKRNDLKKYLSKAHALIADLLEPCVQ